MIERCIIPFAEPTTKDNNNTTEGRINTKPGRTSPTTLSIIAQSTAHKSETIIYENRKGTFTETMCE